MLLEQDRLCAICGSRENRKINGKYATELSIDHCHRTGKVRGLLCHCCNLALGLFKDNPALLEKAASYLMKVGS
jgi:hypothetical protein